MAENNDITRLVNDFSHGDQRALEQLIPALYTELKRVAGRQLKNERSDHTLSCTALVHEAYMKMFGAKMPEVDNRRQFLALFANTVRQVLIDHARQRSAQKRPPQNARVAIHEIDVELDAEVDLIEFNDLIDRLAEADEVQSEIVKLRFFCGLSFEEIAETLQTSLSTVFREWRMARAWLKRELN